MLPRLMSEDELRDLSFELLNKEKNLGLKEILTEYSKDDQLEGLNLKRINFLLLLTRRSFRKRNK